MPVHNAHVWAFIMHRLAPTIRQTGKPITSLNYLLAMVEKEKSYGRAA